MSNKGDHFKFYPKAWLGDEKLSLCAYATKGAWMDLLCHMHSCDPYGYLIINNRPLTKSDVSNVLKFKKESHFDFVWNELLTYGILKYDNKMGAYYSKKLLEEYNKEVSVNTETEIDIPKCMRVLTHFVDTTGSSKNIINNRYAQNFVASWVNEYDEEDFYRVTEYLYDKWKDNEVMKVQIVATTFFGKKFPKYVLDSSSFQIKKKTIKKISDDEANDIMGSDQWK